jgi:heme exporter protein A
MSSNAELQHSHQPLLSARGLFCERDDRVLFENLNFQLQAGQVMQVRGSNGSGKTTLMRILCGLNDSYDGEIFWQGEPVQQQIAGYRASLLYIGHRVGVNKVLTPMENLRWSCSLQTQASDQAILQALAEVELMGFEESACYTLSAGQQQRVSLARLLLSPAALWVLDEPFTTLDAHGVSNLEELLESHANAGGSALVTTHHILNVADLQVLSLG